MIRELVLVTADLAATPWARAGQPPLAGLPSGLAVHAFEQEAVPSCWTGAVSPSAATERFAAGDRCIAIVSGDGAVAAEIWCAVHTRYIDWIGCTVSPPTDHVLLYNAWVAPAYRGHGLQWALASAACGDTLSRGYRGICAGLERGEYAPFARKYAAMGLAVIEPIASLWAVKLFGHTFAMRRPPPAALRNAIVKAREIFARQGSD